MKSPAMMMLLFLSLLFVSGCELFEDAMKEDEKKKPEYILSVHEVIEYPTGIDIEKEVPCFNGKSIIINSLPNLHSRNIESAKPMEIFGRKGFYDLVLKLDRQGKIIWISLTQEAKMKKYGLLVDGVFYRTFEGSNIDFASIQGQETVVLKGPFDQITAFGIEKNAKKNFKHFQKGSHLDNLWK